MENYSFLVWNRVRSFENRVAHPHQDFPAVPSGGQGLMASAAHLYPDFPWLLPLDRTAPPGPYCSPWTVLLPLDRTATPGPYCIDSRLEERNENLIALIVTDPDKRNTVEKGFRCLGFKKQRLLLTGASCVTELLWHRLTTIVKHFRGAQRQFSENICSKDDLRSTIFGTFVVKFLACLPLLGFSNI